MNLSDEMGSEVGGGSRWGTHVYPWLIYVNVWQKTTTILKIKIEKKKEKIISNLIFLILPIIILQL